MTDEGVVKVAQRRSWLRLEILVAKLLNLKLAERVVKIGRVIGPSPRLLEGVRGLLKPLLDKQARPLLDRPTFRMELDSNDVSAVAQKGFQSNMPKTDSYQPLITRLLFRGPFPLPFPISLFRFPIS